MKVLCGCCEPEFAPTPAVVENRPALSAIAYRIGTFGSFRQSMLLAIAREPELAALTTRRSDDYAITILELWAAVGDVLTFYQERYANEAFLRTAQFRDSIASLAALLGYRLRPGVAARAWIAFTLDSGKQVAIAAGQKVQSVPAAGQSPQTFETLTDVSADARFNRLRLFPPPVSQIQLDENRPASLLDRLQGPSLAQALAPGDTVLLFNDNTTNAVEEKRIASVVAVDDRVTIAWTEAIRQDTWSASTKAFKFKRTFRIFGHNAPPQAAAPFTPDPSIPTRISWQLGTLSSAGLSAGNTLQLDARYDNLAPGRKLLIADTSSAGNKTLVTVTSVRQVTAAVTYAVGSSTFEVQSPDTVTEIVVDPDSVSEVPAAASRRSVVVYELDGPPLVFAGEEYDGTITGDTLYLPGVAVIDDQGTGVEVGRTIERNQFKPGVVIYLGEIETGRQVLLSDGRGQVVPATIKSAPQLSPSNVVAGQFCHLTIPVSFEDLLSLDTATAVLLGNVALASHGEKVLNEIVGSGDASIAFPRYTLAKKPLTFLPAASETGSASTLQLYLNGIRWSEVPQLFGQRGDAQVYELYTADDGATTIQFGDGLTGAKPPSGRNNLVANYRVGSGLAGRVAANSLTTLLEKPTGLAAAVNPLPAEGGADQETLAEARDNAPRTVRTFGRIVSLQDFEDQATASGEIAKALATFVWDGLDRAIHLTIAGQEGEELSDDAHRDLGDNLRSVRDPNHRLLIDNYVQVLIQVRAGVKIDPNYITDDVVADARARVSDYFAFDNLRLGEPVHLSGLYRVLQETPGVVYADVDLFQFKKPAGMSNFVFLIFLLLRGVTFLPGGLPNPVQARLRIFPARPNPLQPGNIIPAELAFIESPAADIVIDVRA